MLTRLLRYQCCLWNTFLNLAIKFSKPKISNQFPFPPSPPEDILKAIKIFQSHFLFYFVQFLFNFEEKKSKKQKKGEIVYLFCWLQLCLESRKYHSFNFQLINQKQMMDTITKSTLVLGIQRSFWKLWLVPVLKRLLSPTLQQMHGTRCHEKPKSSECHNCWILYFLVIASLKCVKGGKSNIVNDEDQGRQYKEMWCSEHFFKKSSWGFQRLAPQWPSCMEMNGWST